MATERSPPPSRSSTRTASASGAPGSPMTSAQRARCWRAYASDSSSGRLMMSRATAAAEVAEAPGQGQRAGLLGREVDDEEVRAGQIDRRALRLHGEEHPPDLEGEAGGRTLVAEAPEHLVVAAAPHERRAEAGDVGLEVHARVVVEAAHLAEVEQHRVGEPVGAEQAVHLGEIDERGLRARVLHERLRALEHVAAPVEPGQGQEQLRHRGRAHGAHRRGARASSGPCGPAPGAARARWPRRRRRPRGCRGRSRPGPRRSGSARGRARGTPPPSSRSSRRRLPGGGAPPAPRPPGRTRGSGPRAARRSGRHW